MLGTILAAEIVLTLTDFVVEIRVRQPIGDVYAGERVTHAIMGIAYGLMLAHLLPEIGRWWQCPTAIVFAPVDVPQLLRWTMGSMASGVFLSGVRDLAAAMGLPVRT